MLTWGEREWKMMRRGQRALSTQSGSERHHRTNRLKKQYTEAYLSAVDTVFLICEWYSTELSLNNTAVFGTP